MARDRTRRIRAQELVKRLEAGPSFTFDIFGEIDGIRMTAQQRQAVQRYFEESYRIWSRTWVLPVVKNLVPELRDTKNEPEHAKIIRNSKGGY